MKYFVRLFSLSLLVVAVRLSPAFAEEFAPRVTAALERAGDNRGQIQAALDNVPMSQKAGLEFLIAYMPQRDLEGLSSEFLLENVQFAYRAWEEAPWKDKVSEEIFFNNVLPYANINEGRDRWRKEFYERFKPLVGDAKSPAQAAAILNQQIFSLLEVRYSTERKRADQAPNESIKSGLASCTGLSILLIDACRAVGVPARFAGTPLWSNNSGNHSWVEVWDEGWHFTGAAEPAGDRLDEAWFIGNASAAQRDHRLHAIYAVSYQHTPQSFPLVWDPSIDYIFAVNVTDRYTAKAEPLPEGSVKLQFRVVERTTNQRQAMKFKLIDAAGNEAFAGQSKDERFDSNDHLVAVLKLGATYRVEIRDDGISIDESIVAEHRDTPVTIYVDRHDDSNHVNVDASHVAVEALRTYLAVGSTDRGPISSESFATVPLTREDAEQAARHLWKDYAESIRETRAAEMEARKLTDGELSMPFYYTTFGEKPDDGRSMFISMHGGGETAPEVNDQQWENQKRLYELTEGVYVAPRAPTNTWDLWHQSHIDRMFARLIEDMIVFENVNPNRVYLMGYSAGGDGTYQVAARMADRLAAASAMAGHPNETSPLGLRNLPFMVHVGELDAAYQRNEVARQWQQRLADLKMADPEGYVHAVKIYPGKGHWLDREDAAAIGWMHEHARNARPMKIVWKQDDVTHTRFYWLGVSPDEAQAGREIVAHISEQTIALDKCDAPHLLVRLSDSMLDLDKPVLVTSNEQELFSGRVSRQIAVLAKSLEERADPTDMYSAEIKVALSHE